MRYRNLMIASGLTAVGLAIVAAIALGRLPAGTQLPTHWGPDGLPDRFADADIALFMPVALTLVVSLSMAALPSLEPLQDKLEQSAPLYRTAWIGLLGIMILVETLVAAPAFGIVLPATTMLAGMGVFLAALGNVLPKSRPGFFVGIRTPWAIIDPDNWIATHRYGGRIMMASGLALIVLAALPMQSETRASFVIALLLTTVATPILYSFFYWRRTRRTG
ncbi:SdpI family protein [Sphingomonas sp. R86520]|uniref:SdpI family protein n=1 Tax=Sphingomonas sp. R86520 TaxID=3093859 RepID=UPI0036D2BC04